ncbi:MAG: glycoside hydrolase family 9 protein [Chitinispirillaceae bacterium]|nr:glycoside hydrolase family 9 protein [Chitinispirillaceae bacterium]
MTNRTKQLTLFCIFFPTLLTAQTYQPKFTAEDYKRALWMTTRFYGAQRSGYGPNWLIIKHDTAAYRASFTRDSDGSTDLEGGWFDCGDHVTFGQTFFFSTYVLAKAYDMFPLGYHDFYHGFNYDDYVASGSWDMDGGTPDGMPDLLQELKYATDWIIKATPDGSNFYYQKGEGAKDHKLWVTAGKMSTMPVDSGGEPRKIYKNPDDGVMASLAAATLAVMSRIYKKYDEVYAAECLQHAKNAYTYAKARKGSSAGAGDGGYYGAHSSPPVVAFITGASEMFAATNDAGYKNDAVAEQDNITYHNYGFDYSNTHDLAPAAMATSGIDVKKLDQLKSTFIDQYTQGLNGEGICTKGNGSWGALRYPSNHAFIAALWSRARKDTSLNSFIYKQVDYIMGSNNEKQSFIVGFCAGCSKQVLFPHHRNVYLCDDNPNDSMMRLMTIPDRNKQFGYMVGGTWNSSDYKDDVTVYSVTEGGIDYNAGLVGALGYIVSRLDPADTATMVGVAHRRVDSRPPGVDLLTLQRTAAGWLLKTSGQTRMTDVSVYDCRGRQVYAAYPAASTMLLAAGTYCKGVYHFLVRLSDNRHSAARSICVLR